MKEYIILIANAKTFDLKYYHTNASTAKEAVDLISGAIPTGYQAVDVFVKTDEDWKEGGKK